MKNIYQFRGATEYTLQVYITAGSAVQCRAAGVNVHARVCSQDGMQCNAGQVCSASIANALLLFSCWTISPSRHRLVYQFYIFNSQRHALFVPSVAANITENKTPASWHMQHAADYIDRCVFDFDKHLHVWPRLQYRSHRVRRRVKLVEFDSCPLYGVAIGLL